MKPYASERRATARFLSPHVRRFKDDEVIGRELALPTRAETHGLPDGSVSSGRQRDQPACFAAPPSGSGPRTLPWYN